MVLIRRVVDWCRCCWWTHWDEINDISSYKWIFGDEDAFRFKMLRNRQQITKLLSASRVSGLVLDDASWELDRLFVQYALYLFGRRASEGIYLIRALQSSKSSSSSSNQLFSSFHQLSPTPLIVIEGSRAKNQPAPQTHSVSFTGPPCLARTTQANLALALDEL